MQIMIVLSNEQLNRALGVLPGLACGDALGAGYEFLEPLDWNIPIFMKGGGVFGWAPGEWTDDTSQAILLIVICSKYQNILSDIALNNFSQSLVDWASEAPDVGSQTQEIIFRAKESNRDSLVSWVQMHQASNEFSSSTTRSSGNGSLMRIAGIFPAILDEQSDVIELAKKYSGITHSHEDTVEACALWLFYIREAILVGSLGVLDKAVHILDLHKQEIWRNRINEALQRESWEFSHNGWVVESFQAALSAIHCNKSHPFTNLESDFSRKLEHAARSGNDTDTVAAIAGGLLGALHGLNKIPKKWLLDIHGWPNDMHIEEMLDLTKKSLRTRARFI